VTGLANSTTYTFRVSAVNAAGTGTASATTSATTATAPGAPTALAGSRTWAIDEIALSWTAPSSDGGVAISDYIIEYSADGTTWTTFSDGGSSTASATVTGLANSTTYTFRVSAVNAAGTGTASTTSAITHSVPSAPTGLWAECMPEGKLIGWTMSSDNGGSVINTHVVEYSSDAGETWTTASGAISLPQINLGQLVNGTAYLVRVAAVNDVGPGDYSDNLSFTARGPGSPPDCPS
jgi:titin